jgi:hypothetical protein
MSTWVNADGLTVRYGARQAQPVTTLDERAVDGELRLTPEQYEYLKAPGNLSGVIYDSSNRATTWAIDGVTYNAVYAVDSITVTSSDGLVRVMSLDTMGRYASSLSGV